MKRFLLTGIFSYFFLLNTAYSVNELRSLDFLPRYSIMNSSCFGGDSSALLINPAGLYSADRMTAEISSGNLLNINFIGLSTMVPGIGGAFSFNIFNTPGDSSTLKRGFALGWGRDVLGCFAIGGGLKTVSRDVFDTSDGLLFDVGLIFFPNESLNLDLFKNSMINNKIFFSFVAQNIGKQPSSTSGEDMNLRVGFGYNLDFLWTKVFVEKMFMSREEPLIFGAELNPTVDFLKLFVLRASYDLHVTKLGFGIHGEDAMLDFSYSLNKNEYYFSFNVSFEKGKQELSKLYYDEGLVYYNQAVDLEKSGNDAFDEYHLAYDKFSTSVSYDKNNKKAEILKTRIANKINDYKNQFLTNAQYSENKKDPVSALIYYNKASQIDNSSYTTEKINSLSTNDTVVNYVKNKKAVISSALKNKKYFTVKKESAKLLLVIPRDKETQDMQNSAIAKLKVFAEAHYQKAQNLYDRELYEDCIAEAKTALTYDPDMEKARDLLSLASSDLLEKQGIQRAYELFKNKNYIGAYKMANYILSKSPDNKEASDLKARTLRVFKENSKSYLNAGINYYNNSEYDKAVDEFYKVLLVDPSNSIASDYKNRAVSKQKAIEKLDEIQEE